MRRRIFKTKQLLLTAILLITTTTAVQADFSVNIYINESNRINLIFNSPAQIPFSENLVIAEQFDQYQTSSGYTFAGWYKIDNTSWPVDSLVSEWTEIYARWNAEVTFDSKGGSAISPSTSQCRTDLPITMPGDPTFPGFNFDGWYYTDDVNSVKKWDLTKNITAQYARAKIDLYAHWNPIIVLNTSIPAGLTSNMPTDNDTIITYNGTFDFILTPASGRHFRVAVNGNYITESGGVFTYTFNNVTAPDTIRTITADEYFLVGYNSQGGSAEATQTVPEGTAAAEPSPEPTRTGYTFGGWYTDQACTNQWSFATLVTANITLYAQWKATVTFDSQGGNPATTTQTVIDGQALAAFPATPPTLAGHIFDGWYREASCTNVWNLADAITQDTTLYAKWLPTYTATFNTHGGSAVASQTVVTGTIISTAPASTLAGHTFNGWYTAATGGTAINFPLTVVSDTTLHARWTAIPDEPVAPPFISRSIVMPQITGIATYPAAGMHYVQSQTDFVFEMWALDGYSLNNVTVTTDRGNEVVIADAITNEQLTMNNEQSVFGAEIAASEIPPRNDVGSGSVIASSPSVIARNSLLRGNEANTISASAPARLRVTIKHINASTTILIGGVTVGIEQIGDHKFTVYPNPTDGIITVKNLTAGKTIYIYSMSGTLVSTFNAIDETQKIDLTSLAKGTYLLRFEDQTLKIIKN